MEDTVLVGDTARQIVIQGTPLWVYFLAPIATLVGIALAYFTGKLHGWSQTLHEGSARVIMEIRDQLLDIMGQLGRLAQSPKRGKAAIEALNHLKGKERELDDYYARNSAWLKPDMLEQVQNIMRKYRSFLAQQDQLASKDSNYRIDPTTINDLRQNTLAPLVLDLDHAARRLLGTHQRWIRLWNRVFPEKTSSR